MEPAPTERAAPLKFALKKKGSFRFCVEYRNLNAVTMLDIYLVQRIEEVLNLLRKAAVFSTLEANREFWQVEFEHKVRDNTAFTSHIGLYRFMRMQLGIRNAPSRL